MFGDIAYIRVAFFGPDTEKLLRKALGAIKKEMEVQAVGILSIFATIPAALSVKRSCWRMLSSNRG